jgi:hypothetical protein
MGRLSNIPFWPEMMRQATAAAYCDATVAEFEREVATGRLPMPIDLCSGNRWRRSDLDAALGRLTGDVLPDWRAGSALYAQR